MFATLLADGFMSGASERVAAFVIKCLAVGGGFLVGYAIGWVIAWALNRWVFAQKAPDQLKKAISLLAGTALAILVALIVFGDGGKGLFGGGSGDGDGKGTPNPADNGKDKTPPVVEPPKKDDPKKKEEIKTPDAKPTPGDVRVAILGGADVKESRFYLIDEDPVPKTFEEFKDEINKKRKNTKTEMTIVFRFKNEPLSETHTGVRQVVTWVNEMKLLNRFE